MEDMTEAEPKEAATQQEDSSTTYEDERAAEIIFKVIGARLAKEGAPNLY